MLSGDGESERTQAMPLTPRLAQLGQLYNLLSANTAVDHPLCTECMDGLLALMAKELEEGKRDRDRLIGFEREVGKRREEGVVGRDVLAREIAKVRRLVVRGGKGVGPTHSLIAAQESGEAGRRGPQVRRSRARGLEQGEGRARRRGGRTGSRGRRVRCPGPLFRRVLTIPRSFWRQHSTYLLDAASLRDRTNSLQTRYAHDVRELEKLQKTNVYSELLFRHSSWRSLLMRARNRRRVLHRAGSWLWDDQRSAVRSSAWCTRALFLSCSETAV